MADYQQAHRAGYSATRILSNLARFAKKAERKLRHAGSAVEIFPELLHPIRVPQGFDEGSLLAWMNGFALDGQCGNKELTNYLNEDFRRFVLTMNLLPSNTGRLLEIGANPYFTSILIKRFTEYDLWATNFFGADHPPWSNHVMYNSTTGERYNFEFCNVNVEVDPVPYQEPFDVVLLCEVLEHLTNDPVACLLNLKNRLKPGGHLILTTPNVSRLENVARLLAGANLYDPYSGYGPYGRHNREYNKHELFLLLDRLGYQIEVMFSSDVHSNASANYFALNRFASLLDYRRLDLGQYIFIRCQSVTDAKEKLPSWLYRSYPSGRLDSD